MYNLTNLESNETRGFETRDQLIRFLEEQSAYCKGEGLSLELKLLQVDHDNGEVLDNLVIALPLQRPADNLLLNFGRKKEPKKTLFNPFAKKPQPQELEVAEPAEDEPPAPALVTKEPDKKEEKRPKEVSPVAPEPGQVQVLVPRKKKSISILFLTLMTLGLAGLSAVQFLQVQALNKSLAQLEMRANTDRRLDVFGRYFLSHYYSAGQQVSLVPFLAPNLTAHLKPDSAGLASAILEEVTPGQENHYNLTYILTIKEKDAAKQVAFTIEVRLDEASAHGYLVTQAPAITPYPNTKK